MRQWSVHTEYRSTPWAKKKAREQAPALHAARKIAATCFNPAKRNEEPVGGNVPVAAEDTVEALPEIGNHNDVGLVITGPSFDPCLPFTHLIGSSQVAVPVCASNLQTAEVELHGTITAVADVQVEGSARLLRDEFLEVRRIADAEFLEVLRTVGVHWVRAGFFRCGNVRTGHYHSLDFSRGRRRAWRRRSRQL